MIAKGREKRALWAKRPLTHNQFVKRCALAGIEPNKFSSPTDPGEINR
jgi:hypothetical protein